jgi:hypothetical protein
MKAAFITTALFFTVLVSTWYISTSIVESESYPRTHATLLENPRDLGGNNYRAEMRFDDGGVMRLRFYTTHTFVKGNEVALKVVPSIHSLDFIAEPWE